MRYQRFACVLIAAAAGALSVSSAASAAPTYRVDATKDAAMKWELGFLGLSAIDAAETLNCIHKDKCHEVNPLFGKHPSAVTIIAAKVGLGLVHFATFKYINDRNPKVALRAAQISAGFQGGVVLLNARFGF